MSLEAPFLCHCRERRGSWRHGRLTFVKRVNLIPPRLHFAVQEAGRFRAAQRQLAARRAELVCTLHEFATGKTPAHATALDASSELRAVILEEEKHKHLNPSTETKGLCQKQDCTKNRRHSRPASHVFQTFCPWATEPLVQLLPPERAFVI